MENEVNDEAGKVGQGGTSRLSQTQVGQVGQSPLLGGVLVPVSRCDTCRFWRRVSLPGLPPEESGVGNCQRRAPAPVWEGFAILAEVLRRRPNLAVREDGDADDDALWLEEPWSARTHFPITYDADWCGDFAPKTPT